MSERKFIESQAIFPFLEGLAADRHVLVPVCEGNSVVFRPLRKEINLELKRMPTLSPKEVTFPRTEVLMSFTVKKGDGEEQQENLESVEETADQEKKTVVELHEHLPEEKTIVFGSRPCGAKGKTIFSRVYETDEIKDPYFIGRRDNTIFVSIACAAPENTCFCTSVDGGPADTTGSDVLLTPVSDGFVAEAVTEAGEELLQSQYFGAAGDKESEAQAVVEAAQARLGDGSEFVKAREKLIELFDNDEFWEEMSAKCISCGTCTYLCPTCYCFNITDEMVNNSGKRIRTWDNCMDSLFTLEASGHNPRTVKAKRLKNRVGHKFSYYPSLHDEVIACCGCGRCIKSCPAAVDIREIVKSAQEREDVNS